MKRIALFALAALAACSTDTLLPPPDATLAFAAQATQGAEPYVRATGREGEIVVDGLAVTSSPCHTLAGALDTDGSALELTVTQNPHGGACAAILGHFTYEARIGGLEPGTYRVRVAHRSGVAGEPVGPILDQRVTVR